MSQVKFPYKRYRNTYGILLYCFIYFFKFDRNLLVTRDKTSKNLIIFRKMRHEMMRILLVTVP